MLILLFTNVIFPSSRILVCVALMLTLATMAGQGYAVQDEQEEDER
jgi:hypothetical protein